MEGKEDLVSSHERLMNAIQHESQRFQELYLWLEKCMPPAFFEHVNSEDLMIVAHNLMSFHLQNYFSQMSLAHKALVMCVDSPDADLQILELYSDFGIKNYRAFVSTTPPPVERVDSFIRVAVIHFTEVEERSEKEASMLPDHLEEVRAMIQKRNPEVSEEEFNRLIGGMNQRFIEALTPERLSLAMDMFFRAKTRDNCQYEVRYNEDWKETNVPSVQIMLAWRNTPKHNFLYRLARMIHRHHLVMQKVNAAYIDPYSPQPILTMGLGLHGSSGEPAWEAADMPDFLRELVILKYFGDFDLFDQTFVQSGLMRYNLSLLLRCAFYAVHQVLVHLDAHQYTVENVKEAMCRHPELTLKVCEAFEHKFHPDKQDLVRYETLKNEVLEMVDKLDTGREVNDIRRKNVLRQLVFMVEFTLKTNFYRNNKPALSFRLDPKYLDKVPYDRKKIFPELPYAIFYVKGMHFFGYHIRFKDLSRGGLRTVFPSKMEHMEVERNQVFQECYNLAYTQHKKNKDIPEGGAKGVIFLKPYTRLESEIEIYRQEMEAAAVPEKDREERIEKFRKEQKLEYLYQTQRAFVSSLLTLVNCHEDGTLKAKHVIDYWKRPEYIYLGPDENMHDKMIVWIAALSRKYDYKPGGSFISSKPNLGINHKQYGVTSLGVNVYMTEVLKYLGIRPEQEPFTIKMSGGPDGDVAGNQIANLHKYFRGTAKLLALTDGSGTIHDPEGLNLDILNDLFLQGLPIKHYPPEAMNSGGFLLNLGMKKEESALSQRTLCWRKKEGAVMEDWLSGHEMNYLFRSNVHQTTTDMFVPCGGRPRTINENNVSDYLDDRQRPTSRAIVEGANLYITPEARRKLEEKGVIIIKDSSANKCGVICSSFEVLAGLALGDEGFAAHREIIVEQILERLRVCALDEARLMLRTHEETGEYLTAISDKISQKINTFTYQILNSLDSQSLPESPDHPLNQCFIHYCPPFLVEECRDLLMKKIPEHHKKAIIASHLASQLVYKKGLDWWPSIVDVLPIVWEDPEIIKIH